MYKIGPLLANLLKVDERDDILFTTPIDYISLMLPKLSDLFNLLKRCFKNYIAG